MEMKVDKIGGDEKKKKAKRENEVDSVEFKKKKRDVWHSTCVVVVIFFFSVVVVWCLLALSASTAFVVESYHRLSSLVENETVTANKAHFLAVVCFVHLNLLLASHTNLSAFRRAH